MAPTLIVLLAEDEDTDVFIMRRTIDKMNLSVELHVAHDGEETIAYLAGRGAFADRALHPLPSLILLDINMPRHNGFEVLEWLKQDDTLTHIPVLMLTSSRIQKDIDRAIALGARAYFVKPMPFSELHQLLTAPAQFLAANVLLSSACAPREPKAGPVR
jgi:CheY-like chemotaxis protein